MFREAQLRVAWLKCAFFSDASIPALKFPARLLVA